MGWAKRNRERQLAGLPMGDPCSECGQPMRRPRLLVSDHKTEPATEAYVCDACERRWVNEGFLWASRLKEE